MKMNLFKWITQESLGDSPMLFVITEELIQEMAECNIGRQLSKQELHRVFHAFLEDDEVIGSRDNAMYEAINSAINNRDNEWSSVDKEFDQRREQK